MPPETTAERPTLLTPEQILARLNPPQAEAVSHLHGPLLILAGAGSGKTRVLAHRVAYLVASGVKPWQIVAVTFTNKAANEMRERIAGLIGEENAREATIGTFHAICARILRREGQHIGLDRSFTIYDRADQVALVKGILRRLDLDDKRFAPAGMLAYIGQRKDELADPATAKRQAANYYEETAARVYDAYQKQLAEDDAVDFDDLLMRTVFLFEQHPDVLERYQKRWQQIMVDEYQDTNRAQYLLCRHLAARHKNLAVVGDDDQSIYSWRGADLRNIMDFERDYPDAKVVKLEQNYRSTKTILAIASELIRHNTQRKDKTLWTENDSGEKAKLVLAQDEYDEADVVMTIRSEYKQKTPMVREAEDRNMPIYVLKTNTIPQMQSSLTSIFALEIDPRDAALRETEEAIGLVLGQAETVELSPQNAYIRRLQHQMAERANLVSRSRGREPYRRVRLYPDPAKSPWR